MSFRFVHAAHLHLDAPMRGIDAAPASIRVALRDASLGAWDRLVRLAIEREAAFLLLAGGLFGAGAATARARAALVEGVRKLGAAGISTLACLGEDDTAEERLSGLAPAATVFDEGRVSAVPIVRDGTCLATVHGASSAGSLLEPALAGRIRPGGRGVQIALSPAAAHAGALPEAGIDYWAVGQSHEQARLHERPWIVSSGTPQGRAPEPGEAGPKGAMVVEADGDCIRDVSFAELDPVRFLLLHVDISDLPDLAATRAEVALRLDAEHAAGSDRVVVVDVTLNGEDSIGQAADRWSRAAVLLAELRREAEGRTQAVWWNRVHDRSTRTRRGGGTKPGRLANVVSERAQALAAAALPRSSFLAQRLEPLRQVWNAEIDLSTAPELVREAASLAIEGLETEAVDENCRLVDSAKRSGT